MPTRSFWVIYNEYKYNTGYTDTTQDTGQNKKGEKRIAAHKYCKALASMLEAG